jgi:hypothetical protein
MGIGFIFVCLLCIASISYVAATLYTNSIIEFFIKKIKLQVVFFHIQQKNGYELSTKRSEEDYYTEFKPYISI